MIARALKAIVDSIPDDQEVTFWLFDANGIPVPGADLQAGWELGIFKVILPNGSFLTNERAAKGAMGQWRGYGS